MDSESAAKYLNRVRPITWQYVHHQMKLRDKLELSHGVKPYRGLACRRPPKRNLSKACFIMGVALPQHFIAEAHIKPFHKKTTNGRSRLSTG
jgi:hypothetical protein